MKRDAIETPYGFYEVLPVWLWPLRLNAWARKTRRETTCRIRGHRWREPHTNPLLGDFKSCSRCRTNEHIGPYPAIRIDAGFLWHEDLSRRFPVEKP